MLEDYELMRNPSLLTWLKRKQISVLWILKKSRD